MKLNEEKIHLLVTYLKQKGQTIATMESCTGGALASAITDVLGSSEVFELGEVTYSNRVKEMKGVSKEIIDTFGVYSRETAFEMAKIIAEKSDATYGIGITGRFDSDSNDNVVYICIYHSQTKKSHHQTVSASLNKRHDNKILIVNLIISLFFEFSRDV